MGYCIGSRALLDVNIGWCWTMIACGNDSVMVGSMGWLR